jgi:hypothetical protein
MSAYDSIPQHTLACDEAAGGASSAGTSAYVSIRQHTSAYDSIRLQRGGGRRKYQSFRHITYAGESLDSAHAVRRMIAYADALSSMLKVHMSTVRMLSATYVPLNINSLASLSSLLGANDGVRLQVVNLQTAG